MSEYNKNYLIKTYYLNVQKKIIVNTYLACVLVLPWADVMHGSCLSPQFSIFLINPPVSNIEFATFFKTDAYCVYKYNLLF